MTKAFGTKQVLRNVDLDVPSGSIIGVLGPSGSGKTTLLRIIAGFIGADAGHVVLGDDLLTSKSTLVAPERRAVGVVPQEGALFPHLDVQGNVAFGLRGQNDKATRVAEMLELVGMAGRAKAKPQELSGGEQQRVALARALAPNPRLVLLDEPFSALDATLRARVRDEVSRILRECGCTAVLVTHDQQEVFAIADAVAVMLGGTIAQAAEPRELYVRPASLEVALFVGESTVVSGRVDDDRVETEFGRLAVDGAGRNGDVHVVIRPEQVELGGEGVAGVIVGVVFNGPDTGVRVRVARGKEITARVRPDAAHRLGQPTTVCVRGPVLAYANEQS